MLSRVAESMFWMSRYVERAENVARFVDVNWHLLLDSSAQEDVQWMALVDTTGDREDFIEKKGKATRENVIQFLTFEASNPNSILSCVRAGRENARSIRDTISSEMWEQINAFYLMLNASTSGGKALDSPYDFFNQIKMASHLFVQLLFFERQGVERYFQIAVGQPGGFLNLLGDQLLGLVRIALGALARRNLHLPHCLHVGGVFLSDVS